MLLAVCECHLTHVYVDNLSKHSWKGGRRLVVVVVVVVEEETTAVVIASKIHSKVSSTMQHHRLIPVRD